MIIGFKSLTKAHFLLSQIVPVKQFNGAELLLSVVAAQHLLHDVDVQEPTEFASDLF